MLDVDLSSGTNHFARSALLFSFDLNDLQKVRTGYWNDLCSHLNLSDVFNFAPSYLQLSALSRHWADIREAEVDRVLSVLSRIRSLKDASTKLDIAVRRQDRLEHEEQKAQADASRRRDLREAKANLLADLQRDMQAAISRCMIEM